LQLAIQLKVVSLPLKLVTITTLAPEISAMKLVENAKTFKRIVMTTMHVPKILAILKLVVPMFKSLVMTTMHVPKILAILKLVVSIASLIVMTTTHVPKIIATKFLVAKTKKLNAMIMMNVPLILVIQSKVVFMSLKF